MSKAMSKGMKVFRIWRTHDEDDYFDYEAKTFQDALGQYRKETNRFLCWTVHLLKGSELREYRRTRAAT